MAEEYKKPNLAQRFGWSKPPTTAPDELDIKTRDDRIGRYFRKYLDKFVFVEFSDAYLDRTRTREIMEGVPIPLRRKDLKAFDGGDGLKPNVLVENMAWVMGCDPHFKYTGDYVAYIHKYFNIKVYESLLKEGRDEAEREEYDSACVHFRASLCIFPQYMDAMYSYARVCREMYKQGEDTEYVGRFKAEALDWWELLTKYYPNFAQAYYYLGYAYLNIGLYLKAKLAWQDFIKKSHNSKDKAEIRKRLGQIEDPVRIEAGCNDISTGRWEEGLEILEPYLDSQFREWWPLHYFVGLACARTGRTAEAVSRFKYALSLNPSHLETMEELLTIYRAQNDKENIRKYEEKMKLIRADLREEEAEARRKAQKEEAKRTTRNTSRRALRSSAKEKARQRQAQGAKKGDAAAKGRAAEAENAGKTDGAAGPAATKSGIRRLK